MRFLYAVAIVVLFAGSAFAQSTPMPRYGEADKAKSPADLERERAAEAAYRKSLSNVPNASGSTDPWGSVRNDNSTKSTAKPESAKRAKSSNTAN